MTALRRRRNLVPLAFRGKLRCIEVVLPARRNARGLMLAATEAGMEPVHHAMATKIFFRRAEDPFERSPIAMAGAQLISGALARRATGNRPRIGQRPGGDEAGIQRA